MSALGTDDVLELMQQVADEGIVPRWRQLADADIDQKLPGDYVTIADRESEARLTAELTRRAPGAVVVGEEATFTDPSRLDAVATAEQVFLVDPVDGTRNFVNGREEFAVMVAELRSGTPVRAWIWQPILGHAYLAERGAGATRDGVRLAARAAGLARPPVGTSSQRRVQALDGGGELAPIRHGQWCCGVDYPRVLDGDVDFLVYKNVKPWDHVPGSLLLQETGGVVRTWTGSAYTPDYSGPGLLSAASPDIADAAWRILQRVTF